MPKKKFIAVMLLFFPAFAWFYLFDACLFYVIKNATADTFWIYIAKGLFYIAIASSAVIGSIIVEKWKRRQFLICWIFLGLIATLLFAVFHGLVSSLLLIFFTGFSFGIGFPTSMAFLADCTEIEERARVSGAAILMTFLAIILAITVTELLHLDFIGTLFMCFILRATGFFAILIDPCEQVMCKERSWTAVLTTNGFWLYFVSWLMFNLAGSLFNLFELPSFSESGMATIRRLEEPLMFLGVVFSALISGFASDRFGRKKTIMFGLSILGLSYGFFRIATSPETYLLNALINGAAWGTIMVSYGLTVIGDFAKTCSKEKFYAIGVIVPLYIFSFVSIFSGFVNISFLANEISTILTMILFISLIPLVYAPETLPKHKIRRRRIDEHITKLKKLVEEEETRNHK
jgi:MFS family permease